MKKLQTILLVLCILTMGACKKNGTQSINHVNPKSKTYSRTVGAITFTGQVAWLKYGTRTLNATTWECMNSYDFCQYEYLTGTVAHLPVSGEAIGEIGHIGAVLVIALDKMSMTQNDINLYYSRDGETHRDASGKLITSGFSIKNMQDTDQSTSGDINIPAGEYLVYEDENSILVVFGELE